MSLAIDSQCLLCHLNRNLELVRPLGTEEQTMAFVHDLMKMYLEAPKDISSPWFAPQTAQLLHDHYGLSLDRYRQEKLDSNAFVLERLPLIRQRVFSAEDPVLAGLRFSILGNYLDFSALRGEVSFETLETMLENAASMVLDETVYHALRADLEKARTLLYLTDNAGEIGFDRIFAEAIQAQYPHLSITFCVRGGIAQNDATREDAAALGIPFPIIDNGNCVPGTQMDMLSPEADTAIRTADVLIAKGMANVETMLGCGHNVYYAFLIKCERFVRHFGHPMFTPMLVKERS